MSDELFERFRKTAADSLSKPVDEIKLEANFADDLDADSLDLVQMVMDLEEGVRHHRRRGRARRHHHRRPSVRAHQVEAVSERCVRTGARGQARRGHGRRRSRRLWHRSRRVLGWPPRAATDGRAAHHRLRAREVLRQPEGSEAHRSLRADRARGRGRSARASGRRRRRSDRGGVLLGTGVGGLETLETQIVAPPREGRAARVAVPRADDDVERRGRRGVDALRMARAVRDDGHGVRGGDARHRQRRSPDRVRPLRRRAHRRQRSGDDDHRHGRLPQHDRAVELGRVAPVRCRSATAS